MSSTESKTNDPATAGIVNTDDCCSAPTSLSRDAAWHRAARQARLLSWLSLAYMAAEGTIAITAAIIAGSVALLGFGRLDVGMVGKGVGYDVYPLKAASGPVT